MSVLLRLISLIIALAITAAVIVYPRWIAVDMHTVPHGWLVMLMLGMSFSYIYAFGFIPEHPILRKLFSPWVAWPLAALGASMIFYH